jgi:hypothetical protein
MIFISPHDGHWPKEELTFWLALISSGRTVDRVLDLVKVPSDSGKQTSSVKNMYS